MNPSNKPHPPTLVHGRTAAGVNVPLHVDANGDLSITASVTGADGAILDGANAAIKATVKNYTNSKPLAVISVDTNGDPTGGSAVSIADGADVAEGTTTDAAVTGDNSGTVKAALRGLGKIFADVWDSVNHWLKVSIQNATLAVTQSGTWNITNVSGTVSLPTGAATETTLGTRLSESDFDTKTGSLTETAPATDTASSGLNGRLQRIAQRLTSLIALLPSALTGSGNFKIAVVEDTTTNKSVNVAQLAGTATSVNSGTKDAGTLRVVLATDQPQLTNKLLVTPDANSAVNVAQWNGATATAGAGAVASGTPRMTLASDDPAVAVLGTTSGAKVITDANGTIQQYLRGLIYQLITAGASFFTPTPGTTGGWSVFNATSGDGSTALTNSAQSVKSSQGTLGGWYIYNPNSSAAYVVIYNVASGSVTVGTTNPAMILTIPATAAANLELTNGIQFGTAITVAATSTAGGNGAPSTALEANFWYK